MDLINFIIFIEDIYKDGSRGICNCTSIYKNELLDAINDFARNKGFIECQLIIKMGEEPLL